MIRFHRLVARLLIVSLAGLGLPLPAQAGMLPTEAAVTGTERVRVADFFDREDVRAQLQARGVSADEVKGRVAALTDEEARELAGRIDSLPAGGDVLGILLTVFIVLLITDILGFTKVFPFTRPIR
ncbi:MAG: hypothetical protein A3G81_27320 [Betaproteobacteria bacterium RIFCSPLOWO2_12_FULL_65_14]|nr:MAG: hypothetical protein A3G81_27320 [Betaproteobacteria bacterium RIFCSPLOWO2_12_FULL_65_14]